MKNYSILIIAAFITTLFACRQQNDQLNIEKTIADLTDKFPQLPKGNVHVTDYYKLVRSVTMGNNIQIQLRSSPDTIEDPQQIIIIINSKGQNYAIPFFSNTYRDYWNFQFDTPIPNIKKTNTTFEKELLFALNTLNLNDTIGTDGKVINEILLSLLHCRKINESDSSALQWTTLTDNHDIPYESSDSCSNRIEKNCKAILSEFHPKKYTNNFSAYWDEKNCRVYQIINNEKEWRKIMKLSISVYRQDCVWHTFTM